MQQDLQIHGTTKGFQSRSQVRSLSQSRYHLGAAWPQETLHLQELQVRQVCPDLRETAHNGSTGEFRKVPCYIRGRKGIIPIKYLVSIEILNEIIN